MPYGLWRQLQPFPRSSAPCTKNPFGTTWGICLTERQKRLAATSLHSASAYFRRNAPVAASSCQSNGVDGCSEDEGLYRSSLTQRQAALIGFRITTCMRG